MPKFCENCGGVVRDDAEYCPNCGFEMEEPDDLAEEQSAPESSFTPKKLLRWMKSDDEYIEETDEADFEERDTEPQGTLDDLRQRYGHPADQYSSEEDSQMEFEEDDLEEISYDQESDEPEEFEDFAEYEDYEDEDEPEEKSKGKGLLSLFAGAFGKNDVYGDEEEDYQEDDDSWLDAEEEDEEPEEFEQYDEDFGMDDTISNQASIRRWKQNDDSYDYEDEEDEDEYLIYGEESNFLKRIIIICASVIALSLLVFVGVKIFAGDDEPAVAVVDERTEALESSVTVFFEEVKGVDPVDLPEYDKLYFGNYEGDEVSLEEDLALFSYYTQYSDMQVQSVESSAITGNIGAVKLVLDGSEESKDYFEESQFRLFGDDWKFDFGYFAQQLAGGAAEPVEPAEPTGDTEEPEETVDIAAEKQAVVQTIRDFDDAWIKYVNTGNNGVFDYLNPGSTAYSRLANANVAGLSEELLELELSNVNVNGNRATIEAYEKFKKNRDGEVSIATYRWLYELKKVGGEWLVDDYSKIDSSSEVQEPAEEEEEADEPEEPASSGLPEGFTLDGSFTGGDKSGGDEVQNVRYSGTTNRLVLEIAMGGEKTDVVGPYQVKRSDEGITVTLSGVEQFTSDAPDFSGGLLDGMKTPVISGGSLSIEFKIGSGVGYKVFNLDANNDSTARLVIDFAE